MRPSRNRVLTGLLVPVLLLAVVWLAHRANEQHGMCASYGREHAVMTKAWSFREWDTCKFFDRTRGKWVSVHER
jgi:hypothetical protein